MVMRLIITVVFDNSGEGERMMIMAMTKTMATMPTITPIMVMLFRNVAPFVVADFDYHQNFKLHMYHLLTDVTVKRNKNTK